MYGHPLPVTGMDLATEVNNFYIFVSHVAELEAYAI
jgi:hypothetical protein